MVIIRKLKKILPITPIILAILLFPLSQLLQDIPYDFGWTLRSLGLVFNILLIGGFLLYSRGHKRPFSYDNLYIVLLFASFFLRLSYSYSSGIFTRQHDIGSIDLSDSGHYAYILRLFTNGVLPDSNNYQFYHPPFYHALSAGWLRVVALIFPGLPIRDLFETLPILSVIIGYLITYVAYLFTKLKPIYAKQGLPFFLLVAYHPIFILLSGRHNNDNLSVFFILLTIYFFMRWRERGKLGNVIGLALSIGLGMMTKLTVAVITPVIGAYMVFDFVKAIKTKETQSPRSWKKQIWQLMVFALIVIPLGLWYPLRNYLQFDQPLGYVFTITNNQLATGSYSIWQRFFIVDFNGLYHSLYARVGHDYNIWFYLIKTSVFGEFSYWGGHIFSALLLIVNFGLTAILAFVFFASLHRVIQRRATYEPLLIGYTLIMFVAYILFNLQYPFGPTMDFRYLIPIIFNSGLILMYRDENQPLFKITQAGIIALCGLSVMFFTFLY